MTKKEKGIVVALLGVSVFASAGYFLYAKFLSPKAKCSAKGGMYDPVKKVCVMPDLTKAEKVLQDVYKNLNFEPASDRILESSLPFLDELAKTLNANPTKSLKIEGHTDSLGEDDFNQKLSEDRAEAVLKYLKSKGVKGSRMTAIGHGEVYPIATNTTEAGRAKNRRVELKIE